MDQDKLAKGGTCCCVVTVVLLFTVGGLTSIEPTEVALSWNWVFNTVDSRVLVQPGYTYIGPFNSLMRYPKTIQTLKYDKRDGDIIDGRTSDGLPLLLGLTFQYRLDPNGVFDLYHTYELNTGDYIQIFRLLGIHIFTETANNFTAYQFFSDKQKIAEIMRKKIDTYFQAHLHCRVESLQINEDILPPEFTSKILESASKQQDIRRTVKLRNAKRIDFQTARIVARAQANVTIQRAHGQRNHILQTGHADASIIHYNVLAELEAYGKVKRKLNLTADEMLTYIWYDSLAGGSVSGTVSGAEESLYVGVSPAVYVSD